MELFSKSPLQHTPNGASTSTATQPLSDTMDTNTAAPDPGASLHISAKEFDLAAENVSYFGKAVVNGIRKSLAEEIIEIARLEFLRKSEYK
jgi:hypothetical protein